MGFGRVRAAVCRPGYPTPAMPAEPLATAFLLAIFGLLMAVSVVFSRALDRLGVPIVLLFMVLGMLAGSEGIGGVAFENYHLTFRAGTIALVFILFDGGLNTTWRNVRSALAAASLLATVGVAATAGIVAIGARLLGFDWPHALLLGAIVSSTDAATVFAVLRGSRLNLQRRVGVTLELESGLNDPMAVILTTAVTQMIADGQPLTWKLAWLIPAELLIGGAVGAGLGFCGAILLKNLRLGAGGLFPVLTLGLALLAFGVATLAHGSGFLAVYVAAIILGNSAIPYRNGLARIHDALAWLGQISMFLLLGLLVFPSRLLHVAWVGLAVALLLAFVARPLAVALCLAPLRYRMKEVGYIGWVGLRGAVPIILATIPVLAGIPGAFEVFDIVFFVVVVNSFLPGATVRWMTRRLDLGADEPPAPAAVIEINSMQMLDGDILRFHIDKTLAVCDVPLAKITFPPGAAIILIVRGNELVAPRGRSVLREGDHVYVFCRERDRPRLQLLFGAPQEA